MSTQSTHIVVVGGGTGGTVVANRLADELRGEIDAGDAEVTLVTDGPEHVYKPMFLYVAFNRKDPADSRRPHRELLDQRVTLRIDRVTDIETDAHQVICEERDEPLQYDKLVVATGATLDPESVDGLADNGHHFYSASGAEALRDELASFTEGHLVLSTIGMPHMCPAAPVEFVLIADEWFRKRDCREDIDITYTYPLETAHAKQAIADWVTPVFDDRDIGLETSFEVETVDSETVTTTDDRTLDHDLFVGIPPHAGGDLISRADLGEEWIEVDQHTLEATRADNVYALGDATDVPTSKAGSAAHYQAGVVADRLASEVRGHTPTARYDGKTLCFVEAGLDEATFVKFHYGEEPVVREPSQFIHWAKLAYNESYWLTARGLL
jgi:sulfide:quinone oxidoreductase